MKKDENAPQAKMKYVLVGVMLPIGPVFAYDDIRIISSAVAGKKKANKEASTTTLR